ncbi:MAG: hypothetical protein C5B58_09040 [Acidobacteria bacterium]|nr:MAG: hypothetical protein C5B58_09040 [Acidobacteriota bacterium]
MYSLWAGESTGLADLRFRGTIRCCWHSDSYFSLEAWRCEFQQFGRTIPPQAFNHNRNMRQLLITACFNRRNHRLLRRANAADDAKSDFSDPMQDLLSSEPDGLRAAFSKTNAPPRQEADL